MVAAGVCVRAVRLPRGARRSRGSAPEIARMLSMGGRRGQGRTERGRSASSTASRCLKNSRIGSKSGPPWRAAPFQSMGARGCRQLSLLTTSMRRVQPRSQLSLGEGCAARIFAWIHDRRRSAAASPRAIWHERPTDLLAADLRLRPAFIADALAPDPRRRDVPDGRGRRAAQHLLVHVVRVVQRADAEPFDCPAPVLRMAACPRARRTRTSRRGSRRSPRRLGVLGPAKSWLFFWLVHACRRPAASSVIESAFGDFRFFNKIVRRDSSDNERLERQSVDRLALGTPNAARCRC